MHFHWWGGGGQKVRIVGAEKVLGLLCGFFFGMVAPLNLVQANHPSPCDLVLLIQ
jgi:hypothetical protein